jgi:hypothetical protein
MPALANYRDFRVSPDGPAAVQLKPDRSKPQRIDLSPADSAIWREQEKAWLSGCPIARVSLRALVEKYRKKITPKMPKSRKQVNPKAKKARTRPRYPAVLNDSFVSSKYVAILSLLQR